MHVHDHQIHCNYKRLVNLVHRLRHCANIDPALRQQDVHPVFIQRRRQWASIKATSSRPLFSAVYQAGDFRWGSIILSCEYSLNTSQLKTYLYSTSALTEMIDPAPRYVIGLDGHLDQSHG